MLAKKIVHATTIQTDIQSITPYTPQLGVEKRELQQKMTMEEPEEQQTTLHMTVIITTTKNGDNMTTETACIA